MNWISPRDNIVPDIEIIKKIKIKIERHINKNKEREKKRKAQYRLFEKRIILAQTNNEWKMSQ